MLVQMYMCNFAILLVVSMKNKYEEDLEMEEDHGGGQSVRGSQKPSEKLANCPTDGSWYATVGTYQQLVCRGKAQLQSERNHTGEQTCDQVVTLAPEPMLVYEM